MTTLPKFDMIIGKPDTAKIELLKWNENSLDDEMFPSEKEALEVLKQSHVSKYFPDRFLLACLFSRKMDVQRTVKMLKSHIKWRVNNGYGKIPEWEKINKSFLEANIGMMIPGTRSKEGKAILYFKMARLIPSEFGIKTIVDYVIWNYAVGTFLNGLDFHRNGIIVIGDLQGVGWKNIDFGLQKKINAALMDNFPLRIHKVILIHPPSIVPALISCFKLFIKKKIMDRIEAIQPEELENYVDKDNLWKDFGGNVEYLSENLIQSVTEYAPTDKFKLRSISKKDKGESKSKDKDSKLRPTKLSKSSKSKQSESESNGESKLVKSSTPKSNSRITKKIKNTEDKKKILEELNIDEIPPEVVEQLKNQHDELTQTEHSEVVSVSVTSDSPDSKELKKTKGKNDEKKKTSRERSMKSSTKET
jgi:hypothetical protein